MKKKDRAKRTYEEKAELVFSAFFEDHKGKKNKQETTALYEDDFDIHSFMANSRDPDTGAVMDLSVDDRDFKTAKNYYDYVFNFVGSDAHPPWMMQMWIALKLFGEFCTVCSDQDWLELDWFFDNVQKDLPSESITEKMTLLENGICPKCKRLKYDLIKNHGLLNYTELISVLGQRSGKSSSAASYQTYHLHRMLKFPKVASLTKSMQSSTELTATFVSLTFDKAYGLLWVPFTSIIENSRWWNDYHAMLDYHSEKYGVELSRIKPEYRKYHHKNIKCYPSYPSKNLRGDTRYAAIIDELGLFELPKGEDGESNKERNADEVHKSLTNSLVTMQSVQLELLKNGMNAPPALMLGVSSPFSIRDKAMRRLADSRTEEGRKNILGVNVPTWKINPFIHRNSPIITMAYVSDAEKAERDFGANPPRISAPFMTSAQTKKELWTMRPTHSFEYAYDKPELLYGKVRKIWTPEYPSVMCIDAGHVNNSFALVVGHFNKETQKTVVTTCLEVMVHEERRVDFNSVYLNLILPILKDTNCVALLADQWQSIDILSRAKEDMGLGYDGKPKCWVKQMSPKRKSFDVIVSMMENGNLILPEIKPSDYEKVCREAIGQKDFFNKPHQHLLLQMLTVKDVGFGKCPTKGEGFTDDIFRALVLLSNIHNERIMERLNSYIMPSAVENGSMIMPAFRSRGFLY